MLHIYSYGTKSKQILIMTPKQAALVNEFNDTFIEAQKRFVMAYGRRWTPNDPIVFPEPYASTNMSKYNKLTPWLNKQHAIRNALFTLFRIDVRSEEIDDHLVKRF